MLSSFDLAKIRELHETGRTREAFDVGISAGELRAWAGTDGRLLAGDLALSLGAPRLGYQLRLRAWRRAPNHVAAIVAAMRAVWSRKGAWAAWQHLRRSSVSDLQGLNSAAHEIWLLRAEVAASFRDFQTAEEYWCTAQRLTPGSAALELARAVMLEYEDRFEDALASARCAMQLRPRSPGPVRTAARLLQSLNRDEEALAVLEEAAAKYQDVPVLLDLATLQSALDRHARCLETLDRIERVSPIIESELSRHISGWRVRLEWRCGNGARAVSLARALGGPVWSQFAERAEAASDTPSRVQLNVPFVAQHQNTCVPATLAALSAYWGKPVGQLTVADEICYGGTRSLEERRWAERNGWAFREFTVTWEAACKLLDRGIPFRLLTAEATSGHAQAICGYDSIQASLLIRDPNFRHLREVQADTFLARYLATGPSGLALVPAEKESLLHDLDLPDAPLHDHIHSLEDALDKHQREQAAALVAVLQNSAPNHWLALRARLMLDWYDANNALIRKSLDELLKRFPDDPRLQLQKLQSMSENDQRDERLALLHQVCASAKCEAVFFVHLAQELSQDARQCPSAWSWARRALRRNTGLSFLADLLWRSRQFEQAFEIYRFCACMDDTNESTAAQYFSAARYLKRTTQALDFLRARFERFGKKSFRPAISLCTTLDHLGRAQEAREVLERAAKLLPDDAGLLFFRAQFALGQGRVEEAELALKGADGRIAGHAWHRVAARIVEQRGHWTDALARWRSIEKDQPLALDAHEAIARLLALTEGRLAALRHLEQACTRFARHFALHRLWFSWQESEDVLAAEPIVRKLLEISPQDPASHCALARVLLTRGKFDEATAQAEAAVQIDPSSPQAHALRGQLLLRKEEWEAARVAFRRAIILAVDHGPFMAGLLACAKTLWDRRIALDFIRTQIENHLVYGQGILAFRELAQPHLPPNELLKILSAIRDQRADLWHAWAAVIREFAAQGDFIQAEQCANAAVEQLPVSASLWREIANLYQSQGKTQAELTAREKVFDLSAGDPEALCRLANVCDRADQPDRAKSLLEDAVRLYPAFGFARYLLATLLWRQDQRGLAVEQMTQAVCLDPNDSQAWAALTGWGRVLERSDLVRTILIELTQKRPADTDVWLRLANLHLETNETDQAMAVLDKVLCLDPRSISAHDLRAQLLAKQNRFAEALASCRLEIWGQDRPAGLCARAAALLYEQGDHAGAIAAMHEVLERNPRLLWGWRAVAAWHRALNQNNEADDALDRLLQFGAQDPATHFWAAEIRLNAGNIPDGVESLERALELDPAHLQARVRLMFVQLETNQFNALQETLQALRHYGSVDWAIVGETHLALRQQNLPRAFQCLDELCRMPLVDEGAISSVGYALRKYGAAVPLEKTLRHLLGKPDPRPVLGPMWVHACLASGHLPNIGAVLQLCRDPRLRRETLKAYLEGTAALPDRAFLQDSWRRLQLGWHLRKLEHVEREWLQSDAAIWGYFGMALYVARAYGAAIRWGSNWRTKQGIRPWTMSNLMNASIAKQRFAEAVELGEAALALPPDHTTPQIKLKLAWLEGGAGRTAKAAKLLEGLRENEFAQGWQLFLKIARVLAGAAHQGTFDPKQTLLEWERLRESCNWKQVRRWARPFRRLFVAGADRIAGCGGGWRMRLWARRMAWNWLWSSGS